MGAVARYITRTYTQTRMGSSSCGICVCVSRESSRSRNCGVHTRAHTPTRACRRGYAKYIGKDGRQDVGNMLRYILRRRQLNDYRARVADIERWKFPRAPTTTTTTFLIPLPPRSLGHFVLFARKYEHVHARIILPPRPPALFARAIYTCIRIYIYTVFPRSLILRFFCEQCASFSVARSAKMRVVRADYATRVVHIVSPFFFLLSFYSIAGYVRFFFAYIYFM